MSDYRDFDLDIRSSGTAEAALDTQSICQMIMLSIQQCTVISQVVCGSANCTNGCSSDTCSACHSYCGAACRR